MKKQKKTTRYQSKLWKRIKVRDKNLKKDISFLTFKNSYIFLFASNGRFLSQFLPILFKHLIFDFLLSLSHGCSLPTISVDCAQTALFLPASLPTSLNLEYCSSIPLHKQHTTGHKRWRHSIKKTRYYVISCGIEL